MRPIRYLLALAGCCALQLGLALYFVPPALMFGPEPISGGDYSTHAEQTYRVLEGLREGHSWVYDVQLLAGFPNGTVFDADNKGWELFSFALSSLGVPQGLAFNLFAFMVFALLPVSLASAARVLGLRHQAALIAALLGTLLFFFDSLLHWLFFVGTLSFLFASYLCPLALALFARFLRESRSARDLLLVSLLLSVIHLIHPYAFFVLAPPMLLSCVRARATIGRRELLLLAAMSGSVIAVNSYWLVPALRHFHYVLDSSFLMSADIRQLGLDFLELLSDVSTTGVIANHTAFRLLVWALAGVGLLSSSACEALSERPLLRFALGWLLVLAYLGDHVPWAQQIQPYRFVVPAMFLATLPAAHVLDSFARAHIWQGLAQPARALLMVALLLVAQHLAGELLYFFPSAMPRVRWFLDHAPSSIAATGFPLHSDYRVAAPDPANAELARFLDAHRSEGRVAVQDAALGEELAWRSSAALLGGFWFCNLEHSRANLFRRLLEGPLSRRQLAQHLLAYNVSYVVLSFPEARVSQDPTMFTLAATFGGYHVYKAHIAQGWLAAGTGQVTAQTNRIEVAGSDPTRDVVLRFHFHEALRCTRGCDSGMATTPNPIGGVPFIRVPAPHAHSFVIENSYQM